jgi:hypothetical protein
MATVNVINVLNKVFGARGLPFPQSPNQGEGTKIAGEFGDALGKNQTQFGIKGTAIRKFDRRDLGSYVFLPATLSGVELPNPVLIISGEKEIVETNIVNVGTVFEKVFTKPYDISIICTLIGENKDWPEGELIRMAELYKKDDLVTIKCALTDIFLQAENNAVITRVSILDAQGAENVEVVQFDLRSNIDFELEII